MLARRVSRSAFTLIELMIVISIITALMTLTAGATMHLMLVSEVNVTQTILDRTQSQLHKSWISVTNAANKETIAPDTYSWIYYNFCAGIDEANTNGRIRVLFVKLKQRQAFPMNFNEALYAPYGNYSPAGTTSPGLCPCGQLQPLSSYKTYLQSLGVTVSSGLSWESSACLLMALQRGVSGVGIDPSILQAGGAAGVRDFSFGAVPFLSDAWGNPIYFSRVPVGCPLLNPPVPGAQTIKDGAGYTYYAQSGAHDPGDPQGYLQSLKWGTTYGALFQSVTQQFLAPGNSSFMIAPMVASGGPGKSPQPGVQPVTFYPIPDARPLYPNQ